MASLSISHRATVRGVETKIRAWRQSTIEVTAEHPASSYGIPVLVVGGDVVLQVPRTKEEPEQYAALARGGYPAGGTLMATVVRCGREATDEAIVAATLLACGCCGAKSASAVFMRLSSD